VCSRLSVVVDVKTGAFEFDTEVAENPLGSLAALRAGSLMGVVHPLSHLECEVLLRTVIGRLLTARFVLTVKWVLWHPYLA
jgi:hypothetical protein